MFLSKFLIFLLPKYTAALGDSEIEWVVTVICRKSHEHLQASG